MTNYWAEDVKIIADTEGVSKEFKKNALAYLAVAASKSKHKKVALDILKTAEITPVTLSLFGLLTDEELGKMAF